ncbi:histidine phosphatase family protein [Pseudalkalibacillus hwajinpoensis]|uniref:histidine phosphatase family protein n=1 Tax=Guptibacillus hwajinpoensis TaxID=208199 RepID=UPI00325BF953
MDDAVVIVLFRHGITEDNRRRAYIGWTDVPVGEEAEFARVDECDLIFTSDLLRCTQTAAHLFPDQRNVPLSLFREMHFGEWEGNTYSELQHDVAYRNWVSDPLSYAPPGGEEFKEFTSRIDEGFKAVVEQVNRVNRKAVIITHGGVIRYLLTKYAPTQAEFWEWKIPHGTGIELEWNLEDLRRNVRCTSLREVPIMAKLNG